MPLDDVPVPAGQVLFVDDDAFYRDLAAEGLATSGLDVHAAASGQDALDQLGRQRFDLVVLDLDMPQVNGFDVLQRVRADAVLADLPVLVITGHDNAESVARAFDLGATSFLAKPLNWLLFVHHVQFVLKAARMQADLAQATRTAEFMSGLKSQLVGTLVSEFQAPLRTAIGFAKLLKEETDGPIGSALYRAWITDLHNALQRLGGTHLKMLNFGRSLAGSIRVVEEDVALQTLITALLGSAAASAARRRIVIDAEHDLPDATMVRVDSVLLGQALKAVLDNAIRLSPRTSTIAVRTMLTSEGGLSIAVTDATPGLSDDQIDEVLGLRPFGSLRPEAVQVATGLKLARILLEAHQGFLRLRPRLQAGMLTELHLPPARVVQTAPVRLRTAVG
jgi:CheY-like chemotaxis protein